MMRAQAPNVEWSLEKAQFLQEAIGWSIILVEKLMILLAEFSNYQILKEAF
jgi:hypothetical protein